MLSPHIFSALTHSAWKLAEHTYHTPPSHLNSSINPIQNDPIACIITMADSTLVRTAQISAIVTAAAASGMSSSSYKKTNLKLITELSWHRRHYLPLPLRDPTPRAQACTTDQHPHRSNPRRTSISYRAPMAVCLRPRKEALSSHGHYL